MSQLSIILKQRRKELGLTLAQIADALNVTEATVQRWESGNIKSIRQEKICKLAEVLSVSPAALMGWEEKEKSSGAGGLSLEGVSQEDIKTIKAYLDMPEDQRRALAKILGVSE